MRTAPFRRGGHTAGEDENKRRTTGDGEGSTHGDDAKKKKKMIHTCRKDSVVSTKKKTSKRLQREFE